MPLRQFAATAEVRALIEDAVAGNKIMVFSKTTCGFCRKVKMAVSNQGYEDKLSVLELDQRPDGADIQAALLELTGQRTVPNVFVNGTHLGGCDDTLKAIMNGASSSHIPMAIYVNAKTYLILPLPYPTS